VVNKLSPGRAGILLSVFVLNPGWNKASSCVGRFGNGHTITGDFEYSLDVLSARVIGSPGDQVKRGDFDGELEQDGYSKQHGNERMN